MFSEPNPRWIFKENTIEWVREALSIKNVFTYFYKQAEIGSKATA